MKTKIIRSNTNWDEKHILLEDLKTNTEMKHMK